jgi:hypothetical protein
MSQQQLKLPGIRRSRANMAPEANLVAAVLQLLTLLGCHVWRVNTGAGRFQHADGTERFVRFGPPGQSDIIGMTSSGRFIAVEAKNEHGRVSPAQEQFLELVRAHGGIGIIVRPADYVDVIEQALKEDR